MTVRQFGGSADIFFTCALFSFLYFLTGIYLDPVGVSFHSIFVRAWICSTNENFEFWCVPNFSLRSRVSTNGSVRSKRAFRNAPTSENILWRGMFARFGGVVHQNFLLAGFQNMDSESI